MNIISIYFLFSFSLNFVNLKLNDIINFYQDQLNLDIYDEIRTFIIDLKSNPENILDKEYLNDSIKNFSEKYDIKFINPMIDFLLFNETSEFVKDFYNAVKNETNGTNVLNYILNVLDLNDGKDNVNMSVVFFEMNKFVNYPGMDKVFSYLKDYKDIIFTLDERIINNTKYSNVYNSIAPIFRNFNDLLIDYAYDFLKYYDNNDKLINISFELLDPGQQGEFRQEFEWNFVVPQFDELSKIIHLSNNLAEAIKNSIFSELVSQTLLFLFLNQKKTIQIYINLIKNWGDEKYFMNYFPEILRIITIDADLYYFYEYTFGNIVEVIKKNTTVNDYLNLITGDLMGKVENVFMDEGLLKNNFSQDCNYLIKNIYFSNYTYTTAFFLKKILIDSTKNKNDFLTYENCIEKKDFPEIKDLNFTVQPVFVIGIVDDIIKKNNLKNSLLSEKYNYISSFCFPYGIYKEDNKEMCSSEDYDKLINVALQTFHNMNTSDIHTMKILSNEFLPSEYVYCIISLIFIFLPLLIWILLSIYKEIKIRSHERENQLQQLIDSQDILDKNHKKDKLISKGYRFSKFYNYLHVFFNISKNVKELFNFTLNVTNFNNLNGITYIRGILGIAMILYILGQIVLVLFNFPSKSISQSNIYNTINNPFYALLFFSLRYAPRIILSCSGYILVYKFLCYIEQEQKKYFIKFLFLQSYRFILLIIVLLFMRFCLYYIDSIISQRRRPMMEIYHYNINEHDEYFFERLITFLLFSGGNNEFRKRQNLIQYFYLPLNEMFLFIFGTAIISFGYLFKIRIDYMIIILILSLFVIKIIFYINTLYKNEYYSTLYFYLYDYGELMLNPIFNLPYYLIGMYFGLVNFSIQKGVTLFKFKTNESYALIEMFENEQDNEMKEDDDMNREDSDNVSKDDNKVIKMNKISKTINNNKNGEEVLKLSNSYEYSRKKKSSKKRKHKEEKNINFQKNEIEDLDDKIKEMPFLISPLKFLNYHRGYHRQNFFRILIIFFFIFIILSMFIHMIMIFIYQKNNKENINNIDLFSLKDIIPNYFLNIFYLVDIELIVFMINWIFFVLYSRSEKSADIFDFFNNRYWSFFTKSYFSFTLISTPIIIYVFYQSETVVELYLGNIFLYFSIDIIFILVCNILFYSCFEFPCKKIFKAFFIGEEIIKMEIEDEKNKEDYYDNKRNDNENLSLMKGIN